MRLGIDWTSLAIFLAAYVFAQIRTIPASLRYGVVALACGAIGAIRLRMGAAGPNLIFVGIAFGLAIYYAVRALRGRSVGG